MIENSFQPQVEMEGEKMAGAGAFKGLELSSLVVSDVFLI